MSINRLGKDTDIMKTIGFIGLGLIGGSIAKTIRKFHPDYHILAYAKHKETLAAALNCGAIDGVLEEKDDRYRSCDYIFLCAPVEYNIEYLKYLKDIVKDGCIITDAGSVKGPIHKAVEELGMENCFIGGHPMAGSERSGFEYSSDHLLENAYYILTPGGQVPLEKITEFSELIDSLGSIPMVLTCEEHDFITAGVSHLPHIIASTLVNLVRELDNDAEYMRRSPQEIFVISPVLPPPLRLCGNKSASRIMRISPMCLTNTSRC